MHPLAGQPAPAGLLIDPHALADAYYATRPDVDDPNQLVSFGTSGHRGTPGDGTFTEAHILATTQAICDYRAAQGYTGPLYVGKDTHALSAEAERTALEVLAGNGVEVFAQAGGGFTPTPVISRAILQYNDVRGAGFADGIVITPSHNPPQDGGFKYNPPNGGPADTGVTGWIQDRANQLLRAGNKGVRREAGSLRVHWQDFVTPYVEDLASAIDMDAIRASGVRIGVDPLGGASVGYWHPLAGRYGLNLTVVNGQVDPTFRFMRVDHDGKIRMDCSSSSAMAGLVELRDKFDVAFGNDPDADRHGIVAPGTGLLNPNHYLAVAIDYLFSHRAEWGVDVAVGKTLVSSMLIDRVAAALGRTVVEVPVGFKWFTPGLHGGTLGFGGEESAGACFLRRNGRVWCTDKDGLLLGLLAAEITAVTGRNPGEHYRRLAGLHGTSYYTRKDTPATPEQKAKLKKLSASNVTAATLAGDPIVARLTEAPGNGAAIGGLKVTTANGWFAARPSGTENLYKLYAESTVSERHLERLVDEARALVLSVL